VTEIILDLLHRLNSASVADTHIIPWSSPVLSFGPLHSAKIATLGLNPSNLEFVNPSGEELSGTKRRFQTLTSLGLDRWSDATEKDAELILESCNGYFQYNPYNAWFKSLDQIISGTNYSYYSSLFPACHLDLIPFATYSKWYELKSRQKRQLIEIAGNALGQALQRSSIELLVLNGETVVRTLETLSGNVFTNTVLPHWALPRKNSHDVPGRAYQGKIKEIFGIPLRRSIKVLGYNHNIQSSYGMTATVKQAIGDWIAKNNGASS